MGWSYQRTDNLSGICGFLLSSTNICIIPTTNLDIYNEIIISNHRKKPSPKDYCSMCWVSNICGFVLQSVLITRFYIQIQEKGIVNRIKRHLEEWIFYTKITLEYPTINFFEVTMLSYFNKQRRHVNCSYWKIFF